jgi:hypothetical protein
MAFELPSGIPNFNTNIPAMPPPLEQYGKMLQLKALQGQQQMVPLQLEQEKQQVQASTLENQQRQLELQSQQAMMKAWSDPDFLKGFTGTDKAQSSGVGFDPDALTSSLISKNVLPKDAMAMTAQFVDRSAKIAETMKAQAQTGEANANLREKGFKTLADRIAGVLDTPTSKAGEALAALKQDLVQNKDAFAGVPQEDLAHVFSADLEHLPAMATLIGLDGKIADFHKSKAEAGSAEFKQQQEQLAAAGKPTAETQQGILKDVAVATNPQVQQGKEQVAAAEGVARANTEINTKRQELSDTQFQTAIGADERLNRMEKSYTEGVTNHNQQAMLALLTDHIGMTLGLQKGARITKDILNEAAQSQPWLAAMKAKFDDNGYLSGVNLSPDQMKQMLDLGYSARENAWQAAGSTAQMYGVKPPPNAVATYNKRDPNARVYDKPALQIGQSVTVKGKPMKVTAVHPDGSFDAK